MIATASSISPINRRDLINAISELPENDFLDLVDIRLNRPKALRMRGEYLEIIDANNKPSIVERWTENCLVEQTFLELATTKLIVSHDGSGTCGITVYKYYNEALRLRNWIVLSRPAPEFVVNLSDLSTRVIAELQVLRDPQDVLKQAVGRIFENIDPVEYHLSIASQLVVRLEE
jgi:hypothetical protein